MNLNELAGVVHKLHKDKGEYVIPKTLPDRCMMVVSEISSSLLAHDSFKKTQPLDLHLTLKMWEMGMKSFDENYETKIKGTVDDKLADTLIRLLDICAMLDIDIQKTIDVKLAYENKKLSKPPK